MARGVAQLVAHHVRDVGVGRSSRLSSTAKAPFGVLLLLEDDSDENATKGVPENFKFWGKRRNDGRLMLRSSSPCDKSIPTMSRLSSTAKAPFGVLLLL